MMDDDDDGLIINGSRVLADTHSYEYEYGKGLFTTARYRGSALGPSTLVDRYGLPTMSLRVRVVANMSSHLSAGWRGSSSRLHRCQEHVSSSKPVEPPGKTSKQ